MQKISGLTERSSVMIAGNITESNQVRQRTTNMLAQRHGVCLQIIINLTPWNSSCVSQNSEVK
jgi:hypothetical protein